MVKRNEDGRFVKGVRSHPETEFKKGQHWRESKPYWEKGWLENEYVKNNRSSSEIAGDFGITDAAIIFWLRKHDIPRRTAKEARQIKKWGLAGKNNGMFGRTREKSPRWKGGCSGERQSFYSSSEWSAIVPLVWKKDDYKCRNCGISQRKMHIHHIVSFSVKEKRTELSNLVLLCPKCHRFVHSKKNVEGVFLDGFLQSQ